MTVAEVPPSPGLYQFLLGNSWAALPGPVRRLHAPGRLVRAVGVFRVDTGSNRLARLLARLMRLPPPGEAVDMRLCVTPVPTGEEWHRTFAGRTLASLQSSRPGGVLAERMGPVETRFRLEVIGGALSYRSMSSMIRLGPLRVPLPNFLRPHVTASEQAGDDGASVIVSVEARVPWVGRLITYRGHLLCETAPAA